MSKRLSYYWKGDTANDPAPRFKQINSGSWNITGNVISENESNPHPNVQEHNLENISDTESEPVVQNKWSNFMNGVWNLFNFTKKSPNNGSSNDFDLEELEDLSKLRDTDNLDQYEHPIYDDSETPIYDEYETPVFDKYENEISTKKTELLKRIDDIVQQNKNETRGGTTNRVQFSNKPKNEFMIPEKDEEYIATHGDDFEYTENEKLNNEYNPNTGINDLLEIDLLNQWVYDDDNSEEYNIEALNTHKELVESIGENNVADLIDFLSENGEDFQINESALEEEEEDNEETLDDLRLKASENNRQSRYALRKHKKVKYT